MAYNEKLTDRVREVFAELPDVEEKKMFRGITFLVNGKMCVSIGDDELLCRIDPNIQESVLENLHCRIMVHNGKAMKGFVFVNEDAFKTEKELRAWIEMALSFNGKAKAAKKKKK